MDIHSVHAYNENVLHFTQMWFDQNGVKLNVLYKKHRYKGLGFVNLALVKDYPCVVF